MTVSQGEQFKKMLTSRSSKTLRRWLDRGWVPPRREWIEDELANREAR